MGTVENKSVASNTVSPQVFLIPAIVKSLYAIAAPLIPGHTGHIHYARFHSPCTGRSRLSPTPSTNSAEAPASA